MEVRKHLDAHFFLCLGVLISLVGIEHVMLQLERYLPPWLA